MHGRGGMGGEGKVMRFTKCHYLKKSRDTTAPGCVRLQDIDGPGGQHSAKISGFVTVFARRNIHPVGPTIAKQPQSSKIIGGYRLLKPADIRFGKDLSLI